MKRFGAIAIALVMLMLVVGCDINKEPPTPTYSVPYITVKNDTGKALNIDVYDGVGNILFHAVDGFMKIAEPSIKVKGYCVLREEMHIESGTEWIAYPIKVISKVCEQDFTLENKVYDLHVTYNSDTNELEFNLVEK